MPTRLIEGPTLNQEYNHFLIQRNIFKWSFHKMTCRAICEDCGCDLTGKNVHITNPTMFGPAWVCTTCHNRHLDRGEPNYDDQGLS